VQDEVTQATVQSLVTNGQLEFINGGWCMHDEAATSYVDMVGRWETPRRLAATIAHRCAPHALHIGVCTD